MIGIISGALVTWLLARLDNVYKFVCSALFILVVVAEARSLLQLTTRELGLPAVDWYATSQEWLSGAPTVCGTAAALGALGLAATVAFPSLGAKAPFTALGGWAIVAMVEGPFAGWHLWVAAAVVSLARAVLERDHLHVLQPLTALALAGVHAPLALVGSTLGDGRPEATDFHLSRIASALETTAEHFEPTPIWGPRRR